MTEISVVGPGDGEVIHIGTTQMRILEDGHSTGHRLGVGEITLAPHTEGPPQHRHAQHDEGFYVVSGTVSFTVAEKTYEAATGTLVMIPPGAPHTFANPGDEPAVLLNTFTPDLYVQYFRDLRDMIASGQDLTPAATIRVMSRYATVPPPTSPNSPGDFMMTSSYTVNLDGTGPVDVTVSEYGAGRPFLLLHGGGGPDTVARFGETLAAAEHVRVLVPVHPGFGGTARPGALHSVRSLAALYVALLDQLGLDDVTVIGNSIGGWIAAEIAILNSPRVSRAILIDAAGLEVPGHPVADFFSMTLDQVFELSFHDPAPFRIDPATLPPAAQAIAAGNRAALAAYAGQAMTDPTLGERLHDVAVPTLVVWGDSDRMVDPEYGRAFAAAIPKARFELLSGTGHMPQVETPGQLLEAIR